MVDMMNNVINFQQMKVMSLELMKMKSTEKLWIRLSLNIHIDNLKECVIIGLN